MLPLGSWWQWLANVWPPTEFEPQFCGGKAFASGGVLLLRQILRPVTEAAGIIAVVAIQSDSTATAVAAHQYRARSTKPCLDPHDAEALNVAVAARNLDMISEEAQSR